MHVAVVTVFLATYLLVATRRVAALPVGRVAGALLGSFGLRTDAALIDPGLDNRGGLFGRRPAETGPMPAAQAETEKLPALRPDLHPDQGPSGDRP